MAGIERKEGKSTIVLHAPLHGGVRFSFPPLPAQAGQPPEVNPFRVCADGDLNSIFCSRDPLRYVQQPQTTGEARTRSSQEQPEAARSSQQQPILGAVCWLLGVPGCSWVVLGAPGCFWMLLGGSWDAPGFCWGGPVVSLGAPGCFCVLFGVLLGVPGCPWLSNMI